jgi:hypothetical protein
MAVSDKPLFSVNGKTLPYNSKVSFTDGTPETETSGQIGGPPVKRKNYENAYSVIKVNIRYSQENEATINQIMQNGDNNIIEYGSYRFTGAVLKSNMIERSYGEDVDLEFNANPLFA